MFDIIVVVEVMSVNMTSVENLRNYAIFQKVQGTAAFKADFRLFYFLPLCVLAARHWLRDIEQPTRCAACQCTSPQCTERSCGSVEKDFLTNHSPSRSSLLHISEEHGVRLSLRRHHNSSLKPILVPILVNQARYIVAPSV